MFHAFVDITLSKPPAENEKKRSKASNCLRGRRFNVREKNLEISVALSHALKKRKEKEKKIVENANNERRKMILDAIIISEGIYWIGRV